jgi:hypothetical protein
MTAKKMSLREKSIRVRTINELIRVVSQEALDQHSVNGYEQGQLVGWNQAVKVLERERDKLLENC